MDLHVAACSLTEMMRMKREQNQEQHSQSILSPTIADQIHVGHFYEIEHSKLPLKSPDQLSSIRVVLVKDKSRMRVSLRYPSINSLCTHFATFSPDYELPSLDEKYTIGTDTADGILRRAISQEELAQNKNLWGFWTGILPLSPIVPLRNNSFLLSELQRPGMIRWGNRRTVRFPARNDAVQPKREVKKKSFERWSAERYKAAEVNMLKVMKEKGAFAGNRILRAELRTAARCLIGDTGLLDHLLKHMAGNVAPGGQERFRRRHNADGAMEYWLENADLVDVRKEAGVLDPFWVPPPGWQPGDCPTQDPVCSREIKAIKNDIALLKQGIVGKENATTTPISSVTVEDESFVTPLKETYLNLIKKKNKIEEQLAEVSHSLYAMEEEIQRWKLETRHALINLNDFPAANNAPSGATGEYSSSSWLTLAE